MSKPAARQPLPVARFWGIYCGELLLAMLIALALVQESAAQVDDPSPNPPATSRPVATTTTNLAMVEVPLETVQLRSSTGKPVVITAVAADPTSNLVAAAGDDLVIRLIDAQTMTVQHELAGHRDLVRTLDFHSRHGTLASAGNDGQIMLWDAGNQFEVQQRIGNAPALSRVCFSPLGDQIAAVGFDRRIFLFGRDSSQRQQLACDCRDLRVVAFRDDGNLLIAAGRNGGLHLFDLTEGNLVGQHVTHQARINDLAFATDRNLALIAGDDGVLVTFDTHSRRIIKQIPVTSGKLFSVAVLSDRLVAVAGSDNVIRVIDIDQGAIVRTLPGHRGSVATLVASRTHLFSGGYDATLRRWAIGRLAGHEQRIAESGSVEQQESEQR